MIIKFLSNPANYKTLIFSLLLVFIGCFKVDPPDPVTTTDDDTSIGEFEAGDINLLFIGNSLTYYNDLPLLVKDEASLLGYDIGVKSYARGNYAIIDHWNDGEVQREIESGVFDYVIIQQGPSSQLLGREWLIEYGARYKALCEANETELAFYMVWPSLEYYDTFDGVIRNYSDAASINNSILCPVGRVWKDHFDATDDFSYYGGDGFHPSLKGSKVAAEVIVETLFDTP